MSGCCSQTYSAITNPFNGVEEQLGAVLLFTIQRLWFEGRTHQVEVEQSSRWRVTSRGGCVAGCRLHQAACFLKAAALCPGNHLGLTLTKCGVLCTSRG